MKWYVPDDEFLNYLRNKESRVPRTDYGKEKYKPFFGALFEVGELVYITQVSHPKERHYKMKSSKDFLKVFDEKRLLAVINLNYMFPIPKKLLKELNYKELDIVNEIKKNNYISLLKKELKAINKMDIESKAKYIYELKYNYPDNMISKRCFDFKLLEVYAKKYKKY